MKKVFILATALLVASCSSNQNTSSKRGGICSENTSAVQDRHLIISAKSKSKILVRCFKNYIKFETNKKQSFKFCSNINVAKSGMVTYTKVFGLGNKLPKDFKMCLEQEYWMMNFKGLQLEKSAYIHFPLEFSSI